VTVRFEPIIEMPNALTGVWRRFGVHLFEGTLTLADMDRLEEVGAAWRKTARGKMVELVVVFPSEARMSGDERARMAAIIKRWEDAREASATVILAEGLVGALHRSVLTGIQMLVPAPHPTKVFGAIAPAVTWLAPYVEKLVGAEAKPAALIAGVEELCARFTNAKRAASATAKGQSARG
jgi:hypothetical protein